LKAAEKAQAIAALTSLVEGKAEVFHSPDREPFIRVPVGDHKENYPLQKNGEFQNWAQYMFWTVTKSALAKEVFNPVLEQLQAQAKFDAPEDQTSVRVAEHKARIYLDLCNNRWEVVEITSKGWQVNSDPPVRFLRPTGMRPLPTPVPGGSVQQLFDFINIKAPSDRALVLAWLLATFRPIGPYPILALHGAQGSAKTTTETILRRMIDPAKVNLSGVPRDERDLLISVQKSYLLGFDNLSKVSDSLSDALSRVATESGLATRKLYTDDQQMIFNGCRPILLNGIPDIATRGDLLDRMIVLFPPKIPKSERRERNRILHEFEAAQPKILGAMLDAVSVALREHKKIKLPNLPRMADFATWAAAGSTALGFNASEFIAAYERNRTEANFIAIENSPATIETYKWASERTGSWEGNHQSLLAELNLHAPDSVKKDQNWPKSARGLSAILARSEPNLAAVGVIITKLPREAGTGQRKYRISFVTSSQSQTAIEAESSPARDGVTVLNQNSAGSLPERSVATTPEPDAKTESESFRIDEIRPYKGMRFVLRYPSGRQTRFATREEAEKAREHIIKELARPESATATPLSEPKLKRRLTPEQESEIIRIYKIGATNQKSLAERFGVSQPYISVLIRRDRLKNPDRQAA
jgi:hypothetical protein